MGNLWLGSVSRMRLDLFVLKRSTVVGEHTGHMYVINAHYLLQQQHDAYERSKDRDKKKPKRDGVTRQCTLGEQLWVRKHCYAILRRHGRRS
jgi:hypothetical protein